MCGGSISIMFKIDIIIEAHRVADNLRQGKQFDNTSACRADLRTVCETAVLILKPILLNVAASIVPAVPNELTSISISVASSAAAPPASSMS